MNEEAKLRAKYGGALPRQQNMLLTKKLMNKVNERKKTRSLLTDLFFSQDISIRVIIMLRNHRVN